MLLVSEVINRQDHHWVIQKRTKAVDSDETC